MVADSKHTCEMAQCTRLETHALSTSEISSTTHANENSFVCTIAACVVKDVVTTRVSCVASRKRGSPPRHTCEIRHEQFLASATHTSIAPHASQHRHANFSYSTDYMLTTRLRQFWSEGNTSFGSRKKATISTACRYRTCCAQLSERPFVNSLTLALNLAVNEMSMRTRARRAIGIFSTYKGCTSQFSPPIHPAHTTTLSSCCPKTQKCENKIR